MHGRIWRRYVRKDGSRLTPRDRTPPLQHRVPGWHPGVNLLASASAPRVSWRGGARTNIGSLPTNTPTVIWLSTVPMKMRLPSIQEKEYIMGFPIDYTLPSVAKGSRGTEAHLDVRHSLIGNSWSVPVIAWLLAQLFGRLGLCPLYSPQDIVNLVCPSGQVYLQSRLWRRPLRPVRGPAGRTKHPHRA